MNIDYTITSAWEAGFTDIEPDRMGYLARRDDGAQAFIPYWIESGQEWKGVEQELQRHAAEAFADFDRKAA